MATQMQDPPSNPNPNNPNANNNAANAQQQFPPQSPATALPPYSSAAAAASSSIFIRDGGGGGTTGGAGAHSHHRRAHSEVSFRLPDDMMDLSPSDPFTGGSSTASLEEIGSEDDLFSTYIDVEKLGAGAGGGNGASNGSVHAGNGSDQSGYGGAAGTSGNNEGEKSPGGGVARPRHRHSSSVDGSTSSTSVFGEIMHAKKAMPPDKLAELWTIDPKRAKRSMNVILTSIFFFSLF